MQKILITVSSPFLSHAELKSSHQEELEAAALDTDVMKSELERAHQAELQRLQEQLLTQAESSQTQEEKASTETGALKVRSAYIVHVCGVCVCVCVCVVCVYSVCVWCVCVCVCVACIVRVWHA